MGLGIGMGPVQKTTWEKNQARGAGCSLLRLCWANNHWHCHQSTPSLLIYLLLIPPA
jgi:hypothetical protein